MKRQQTMLVGLVFFSLLGFSACGKEPQKPSPSLPPPPQLIEGLTPEEREKYCAVRVAPETGGDLTAGLAGVLGTWTHYPANTSDGYRKKEFRLDLGQHIAALTTYYSLGKDVDSITFRKICLSQPLPESMGFYAGYRVLEFLSVQNEGAAVLLVKVEPGKGMDGAPALLISDHYYGRYAAESLTSLESVLNSGQIKHIWTFRERK